MGLTKKDILKKAKAIYHDVDKDSPEAKTLLKLFTKDELEKKEKPKKDPNKRIQLARVFNKCKKMFPIGTLIWNDDGTDHMPNLIVEEPRLDFMDKDCIRFHTGCVYNDDRMHDWKGTNRYQCVMVKTIRLCRNCKDWIDYGSEACLETVLYKHKNGYHHHEELYVDIDKLYDRWIADWNETADAAKKTIETYSKRNPASEKTAATYAKAVSNAKKKLEELEKEKPVKLTSDVLQEYVDNYNEWKANKENKQ